MTFLGWGVAKFICWLLCLLALASITTYAFTGITVWVPVGGHEGRAMLLCFIHVFALAAPAINYAFKHAP